MRPLLIALSLAVVVLAYGPLLWEFAGNLWDRSHYQHFPFVILASGLLMAQGSSRLAASPTWVTRRIADAGLVAAWLLLLLGQLAYSPMFAAASAILLAGALYARAMIAQGRRFPLGSWMLLWLIIPLPVGLDQVLIRKLQLVSSSLASQTLDLIGVYHLMDGNALVLQSKQLFVDEACSGIVSVVSTVACGALYGVYRRRSAAHTLSLMAAGAGWATLNNVVRIVAIALAQEWHGLDWTEGTPHTLIALVTFSLSLLGLLLSDWSIAAVLAPVGPRWEELTGEPLRYGAPLVRTWDTATRAEPEKPRSASTAPMGTAEAWETLRCMRLNVTGIVAFALLAGATFALPGSPFRISRLEPFPDLDELAAALSEDVLPASLAGLELKNVEHEHRSKLDRFGEHSVLYTYLSESGESYLVSIDFPYAHGWHELETCYVGIGWRSLDRSTLEAETGAYRFAQLALSKPDGSEALVTFGGCYADGQPLEPPARDYLDRLVQSFFRRNKVNAGRQSYQIQVLLVRDDAVTGDDRRKSSELLQAARSVVQPLIAALAPGED